ncbi:MAG: hypothetical protein NUV70_08770 [Caldiserica bacterium]|jgi:hypothetical protein|nr:hypothetical protein [Caldisericota bacterium]
MKGTPWDKKMEPLKRYPRNPGLYRKEKYEWRKSRRNLERM